MQSLAENGLPNSFEGMNYVEFVARLVEMRETRTYLEIGVSRGDLLSRINCDVAIGVDPSFALAMDVTGGKRLVKLYKQTSDSFFREKQANSKIDGDIDFVFLDGLHQFEFLLRDFYNAERLCHENSLICMHDCLPLTEAMADRDFWKAVERGKDTAFPSHWTGDVWKMIPILKKHRPDLKLFAINCPPTGLLIATNLDPSSNSLFQDYYDIVQTQSSEPNDLEALKGLYRSIKIIDTSNILTANGHSLFFRV